MITASISHLSWLILKSIPRKTKIFTNLRNILIATICWIAYSMVAMTVFVKILVSFPLLKD